MRKSEEIYKVLKDNGFEDTEIADFSNEYMELYLHVLKKKYEFLETKLDQHLHPVSLRYEDKVNDKTYILKESKIWREKA